MYKSFDGRYALTQRPELLQVERIERVQNAVQWKSFTNQTSFLRKDKYQGGVENTELVRLAWHGTGHGKTITPEDLAIVTLTGWDASYGQTGMHGMGIYFAPNPTVADEYASTTEDGKKQLLLADVLVGMLRQTDAAAACAQALLVETAAAGLVLVAVLSMVLRSLPASGAPPRLAGGAGPLPILSMHPSFVCCSCTPHLAYIYVESSQVSRARQL